MKQGKENEVAHFHTRNMPKELHKRLKLAAISEGKTMEALVNELLNEGLEKRGQ